MAPIPPSLIDASKQDLHWYCDRFQKAEQINLKTNVTT